jgi:hypothetical protein
MIASSSRFFRAKGVPVIFTAVSADGDHGYVFIQEKEGPCIACLFPNMADDDRYPCPGTPAIADILQCVGALAVYAIDTILMSRRRVWNYRRVTLSDGSLDGFCASSSAKGLPHLHNRSLPSRDMPLTNLLLKNGRNEVAPASERHFSTYLCS